MKAQPTHVHASLETFRRLESFSELGSAWSGKYVFRYSIPTQGRDESLIKAVGSAVKDLDEKGRIIVVNDGELDVIKILSPHFCQQLADGKLITIVNASPHGASRARNAGVAASNAELIIFLDDDDTLLRGTVSGILASAEAGFEYGYAVSPPKTRAGQRGARIADLPVKQRFAATSAAFWIRRDVFNAVGQFDEDLTVAEDFDLCARLCGKNVEGWASFQGGVQRSRINDAMQTHSLVERTSVAETVRCRHELMSRNIDSFSFAKAEKFYLIEQFTRRAVRSGMWGFALRKVVRQLPNPIALFGLMVWTSNFLAAPRDSRARKKR